MFFHNRILMLMSFIFATGHITNAQTNAELQPIVVSAKALEIHRSAPVIDGHNDLPWAIRNAGGFTDKLDLAKPHLDFHTDIPRLRSGGVGAQSRKA